MLVTDLLGPSLQELWESRQERRFSLKTVLMIAEHLVSLRDGRNMKITCCH